MVRSGVWEGGRTELARVWTSEGSGARERERESTRGYDEGGGLKRERAKLGSQRHELGTDDKNRMGII